MKIQIINSSEFKTISWSGGHTTEIFIYPPDGNFEQRDFLFRVSTATVQDEESVFTKFNHVKRFLAVIKGTIVLEHSGFHKVELSAYDIDEFLGDWETKSFGCCTDFNLMIKGENEGSLTGLNINGIGQKIQLKEGCISVFYSFNTDLRFNGFSVEKNTAIVVSEVEKRDYVNLSGDGIVLVSSVDIRKSR